MAEVVYDHAYRIYPGATKPAVEDLNLEIADGEFLVLVGPSGCGKSTSLRMLAGLEDVDKGSIYIGGRDVTNVPPKDRDIAMVFQNYALYPHMTVAENMGFALKIAGESKENIRKRVLEAAKILDLEEFLDRKPKALSGGQRQRVAMGRAIVRQPQVFCMDEPLSNLDAKLRVSTRTQIASLQRRLGITTVYVTHDQVEAMTMGDRVAVLKDGVLQQVDTPQNLFDNPVNLFVAGFMGSPSMNFVTAELLRGDGGAQVAFAGFKLPVPDSTFAEKPGLDKYLGKKIILGIRPSDFEDAGAAHDHTGWASMTVRAEVTEELGSEINVLFLIDAPPVEHKDTVAAQESNDDEDGALPIAGDKSLWTARVNARSHVRPGQDVQLVVDTHNLHFFDVDSGLAIGHEANIGR